MVGTGWFPFVVAISTRTLHARDLLGVWVVLGRPEPLAPEVGRVARPDVNSRTGIEDWTPTTGSGHAQRPGCPRHEEKGYPGRIHRSKRADVARTSPRTPRRRPSSAARRAGASSGRRTSRRSSRSPAL